MKYYLWVEFSFGIVAFILRLSFLAKGKYPRQPAEVGSETECVLLAFNIGWTVWTLVLLGWLR